MTFSEPVLHKHPPGLECLYTTKGSIAAVSVETNAASQWRRCPCTVPGGPVEKGPALLSPPHSYQQSLMYHHSCSCDVTLRFQMSVWAEHHGHKLGSSTAKHTADAICYFERACRATQEFNYEEKRERGKWDTVPGHTKGLIWTLFPQQLSHQYQPRSFLSSADHYPPLSFLFLSPSLLPSISQLRPLPEKAITWNLRWEMRLDFQVMPSEWRRRQKKDGCITVPLQRPTTWLLRASNCFGILKMKGGACR